MTQNSVIERCDNRCGKNWHHYCAKAECQFFNEMIKHSSAKAGFINIAALPKKDNKNE